MGNQIRREREAKGSRYGSMKWNGVGREKTLSVVDAK